MNPAAAAAAATAFRLILFNDFRSFCIEINAVGLCWPSAAHLGRPWALNRQKKPARIGHLTTQFRGNMINIIRGLNQRKIHYSAYQIDLNRIDLYEIIVN